jgi:hypothetical protein
VDQLRLPFVQKHYRSGNMQALQKKYGGEVVWLAVNSTNKARGTGTEPAKISKQLKEFGARAGALPRGRARQGRHGVRREDHAHMFIIDGTGKVVYNRRHRQHPLLRRRRREEGDELRRRSRLDELKAGKPVSVASTTPYGCTVKYR